MRFPQSLPKHDMDVSRANTNGTLETFLGPELFISPPSAFTPAHIDGGGIVDALHLCIQGHNKVVMSRPLTGEDLVQANEIIHRGSSMVLLMMHMMKPPHFLGQQRIHLNFYAKLGIVQ